MDNAEPCHTGATRCATRKIILIADDNPDDVKLLEHVLAEGKITNLRQIVSDGAEAIAYFSGEGKYDDRNLFPYPVLLMVDVCMPRKSGLEVLEFLADRDHPPLGIVLLAGIHDLKQVQRAYQLGAHSFLLKPLLLSSFLDLIKGLKGFVLNPNEKGFEIDFFK